MAKESENLKLADEQSTTSGLEREQAGQNDSREAVSFGPNIPIAPWSN